MANGQTIDAAVDLIDDMIERVSESYDALEIELGQHGSAKDDEIRSKLSELNRILGRLRQIREALSDANSIAPPSQEQIDAIKRRSDEIDRLISESDSGKRLTAMLAAVAAMLGEVKKVV
jgi:hypothetical protein